MCESSHFFSGGQTAIAKGINAAQISRTGKFFNNTPETVSGLVDTGLESPKDTLSYKLAEKASQKNGKLSNYEVGQLYNANVEQIAAEESEAQRITGETVENTPSATTSEAYSAVNDTSINTQSVTPIADEGITTSTQYEPVKINDTFRDTKTGNTLRIKERNAKNVTVEVDSGTKTDLRIYPASFVDKQFNTNSRYAAIPETENAVTEDVAHNDSLLKSALRLSKLFFFSAFSASIAVTFPLYLSTSAPCKPIILFSCSSVASANIAFTSSLFIKFLSAYAFYVVASLGSTVLRLIY